MFLGLQWILAEVIELVHRCKILPGWKLDYMFTPQGGDWSAYGELLLHASDPYKKLVYITTGISNICKSC